MLGGVSSKEEVVEERGFLLKNGDLFLFLQSGEGQWHSGGQEPSQRSGCFVS